MSLIARVRVLVGAVKVLGLWTAYEYYLNRFRYFIRRPRTEALLLQPKGVRYPITLRGGTSSDSAVFRQIFIEQEYRSLYEMQDVKCILDLGANTGLAATAFLNHFPEAQVVAVEPDPENYAVCSQNVAAYGARARVIHGAVWSHPRRLALARVGDGREWAVTVFEPDGEAEGLVQSWDPPTLFTMAGFDTVDLLKIDIEHSEIAIFNSASVSWIQRVRNLCIELHSRACEEAFYGAMSKFEYELGHSGELVICRNIRLRSSLSSHGQASS